MGEELQNRAPDTPGSGQPEYIPPGYSTPKPERRSKHRRPARSFIELVVILASAIVVAYLLQAFVVKPFQIPSESMQPTLEPGDRVLVNRLAYSFGGSPERGDLIVFKSPSDPETDYIKRVIAVGGETVEVKRGSVIINGDPLVEDYLERPDRSSFTMQTVPEGTVFVMGDNRGDSQDSRAWRSPWLPVDNIIGKAFLIYWPLDRMGFQ